MRPPRPRRDRLARALRAAADRLAPAPAPAVRPPAPADPAPAIPRRPGEPPEHWLRVVAAHAPGLLRPPRAAVDQEDRVGSAHLDDAEFLIDGDGGLDGDRRRDGDLDGHRGDLGGDREDGERGPAGGVAAGEERAVEGSAATRPGQPGEGAGRSRSARTRQGGGNGRVTGERGWVTPGTDRGGRGAAAGARGEDSGVRWSRPPGGTWDVGSARPGPTPRRSGASGWGGDADGWTRDGDGWAREADGWTRDADGREREADRRSGDADGRRRTDGWGGDAEPDGTDDLAGGVNGRPDAGRTRAWGARPTDGAPGTRSAGFPRLDRGDEPAPPRFAPGAVASAPGSAGPDAARWSGRTGPRTGGRGDRPAWPGGAPGGTNGTGRGPDDRPPATAGRRSDRIPRAGLRVQLSSPGAQQTHPNLGAAGSAGPGPEWSLATRAPWPALPGETTAGSGPAAGPADEHRPRDPWPALPDDRELWRPPVGPTDAARLRRLDREQAGE